MKIETVEAVPSKRFESVGINITFESNDELRVFWAMANSSYSSILASAKDYPGVVEAVKRQFDGPVNLRTVVYGVFNEIDEILGNRGLKE